MIQYFESLDSAVPEEVNPADFFIDVSSVDVRDEVRETNTHAKVDALITAWEEKCLAKSNGSPTTTDGAPPEMQPLTSSRTAVNPSGDPSNGIEMNCVGSMKTNHTLVSTQIHGINSFSQYLILTRRAWTNLLRDNLAVWGNLLEVILVSVVFGGIFYQVITF